MKHKNSAVILRMEKLRLLRRIVLQRATADTGLHIGQLPILEYVRENNGCTQVELAEKLLVSPASIALSTKRMQRDGLLEKRTDECNLRRNQLTVTEKGRKISEQCRRIFDEVDSALFKDFREEEFEQLLAYLDKMLFNLTGKTPENIDLFSLASLENQIEMEKIKNEKQSRKETDE